MPDKKKSRPQTQQFEHDNEAVDYPQQMRLWDESNPNLAPDPGTGPDAAYEPGEPGDVIVEGRVGPNPVGMNPNAPLDKDDDNVGSPTLSTVYDVTLDGRSHKGKY